MDRIRSYFGLLLISWVLLCASSVNGQSVDDQGQWNALFAQGDFKNWGCESDRLRWWFDGHIRLLDDTDGFNQSIVRPGIGWQLNEQSSLWAGYGWISSRALSGLEFDEHRIWQQWIWSNDFEKWKLALRSRFEQRFVETGDDLGLRYRQFFRATHKLPSYEKLSLVWWDELFYHLNDTDWGARSGFNQNRVFAGVGFKASPCCPWRVEVGYLNQVIEVPTGPDRNHHILSVNLFRSP